MPGDGAEMADEQAERRSGNSENSVPGQTRTPVFASGRVSGPGVQHLIGRELTVELDGEVTTLEVVDWADLQRVSTELATRAAGLSRDEINELYNRHRDPVNEIYNYFLYDYDERVISGQWQPFGVLGIGYRGESFAESANDGLLVFDLERVEGGRAPVLWIRDDEVNEVAGQLDELKIAPLRPVDPREVP